MKPTAQPSPQNESPEFDPGRRRVLEFFTKSLAVVSIAAIADQVSGGALSTVLFGNDPEAEKALKDLDAEAKTHLAQIEEENPGIDKLEKTKKLIDYLGTGLFVQGVLQLILKKDDNHINSYQYAALGALTALKYQLSNEEEKEHLVKETEGAARTLMLIGGAMTIGEGLNADISAAWEREKGKKPAKRDLIAVMSLFSAGVSSLATTLVNSTVVRKMANDLAETDEIDASGNRKKDPAVMAVCTSHNTNLSGIALFGNPPFMAVAEKYGFKEGITWKLKSMLPLMVYSIFSSTYKLNLIMAKREALTGPKAHAKAMADTISGLTKPENISFLAKTIAKSLGNAVKYFTGQQQNIQGIEIRVGEAILEKFRGLASIPFAQHLKHPHETHEGFIHTSETKGADELTRGILEALSFSGSDSSTETTADPTGAEIEEAIRNRDYDRLLAIGRSRKIAEIELIVQTLKDFHDNKKVDESSTLPPEPEGILKKINPITIAERATDIDRIKSGAGHSLADVLNVFPFQAGCIPFLVPVFKDLVTSLEKQGLTGALKDTVIFFMIQIFSMFADNYVACKIGLELLPDKPQVALVASELGGPFTPIANMSNLGQFSMNDFSMADSLKQAGLHLDSTVAALAWTHAITLLNKIGILVPPKPLDKKE